LSSIDLWRNLISQQLTKDDKVRFTNLLELASSSEFDGERKNALAAARRIADKYNLSLAEASRRETAKPNLRPAPHPVTMNMMDELAARSSIIPTNIHKENIEKLRWQSAVQAAKIRGLDLSNSREHPRKTTMRNFSKTRRHPSKHAKVLLDETTLPFREIAEITGLNIYQVVCIKLKSREAA